MTSTTLTQVLPDDINADDVCRLTTERLVETLRAEGASHIAVQHGGIRFPGADTPLANAFAPGIGAYVQSGAITIRREGKGLAIDSHHVSRLPHKGAWAAALAVLFVFANITPHGPPAAVVWGLSFLGLACRAAWMRARVGQWLGEMAAQEAALAQRSIAPPLPPAPRAV